MDKNIIKKGFDAAEKEHQEQEVAKIKNIVQKHLEKIDELNTKKKEVEEEIQVHRKNLDDLKAGRLDKIEERLEKDPKCKNHTLIIVRKIEKEYIPLQPWRSPWEVVWKYQDPRWTYLTAGSGSTITATAGSNSVYLSTTGSNMSAFTSGTYTVGTSGNIVNL